MLDKNQVNKKDRFYIAMFMLLLASVSSFGSYLLYMSPKQEPSYDHKREADMLSCSTFAKHKGFTSERSGQKVLTLISTEFTEPKFAFAAIESVIVACDNIEMKSMCFGLKSQCSVDGAKIVLNYAEPSVY